MSVSRVTEIAAPEVGLIAVRGVMPWCYIMRFAFALGVAFGSFVTVSPAILAFVKCVSIGRFTFAADPCGAGHDREASMAKCLYGNL